MTNLVIGVGGLLSAGKDEFADHLVSKHGFVKLGMSDILREATEQFTTVWFQDLPNHRFINMQDLLERDGYVEAKKNAGYRIFLQELGTEVGRKLLGEEIWVDAAKKRILEQLAAGRDVVITGIRFENELNMISTIGWGGGVPPFEPAFVGTTVWVNRPGLEVGTHASEATLHSEDFEYVLDNDGTLDDLGGKADQLLEEITRDYR